MKGLTERIKEKLPNHTIGRYDLLPVLVDRELSDDITEVLSEPYEGIAEVVVAPEAIGWILGEKIGARLNIPMIPPRRGEKLPYNSDELYSVAFMDYQLKRKSLEVAKDADLRGKKVLIVDELIETGAQIKAVMALLEKFGCTVIGIATIYSIPSVRTLRWKEEGLLTAITEEL